MAQVDTLAETIASLFGVRITRASAGYGDPTDPDDDRPDRFWDVVFELELEQGAPTPEAWRSLAFLTQALNEMTIGGRHAEVTINAGQRPNEPRTLFFSIEGEHDNIGPDEVASWLRDLARVSE